MIEWILLGVLVYTLLGVAFAVAFVTVGASRIDDAAKNGTLGFRALILPGAAVLWPILLGKWLGSRKGGTP